MSSRERPQDGLARAQPASPKSTGNHVLAPLRYADFRWLLGAALASSLAYWGETILFGWLALELTGSPFKTGAVVALRSAGYLLSPIAGVIADRYDRRRIIVVVMAFSACYTAALALLMTAGRLSYWHLAVISGLGSLSHAFDNPVRKALVADLVPAQHLPNAYTLTVVATDTTAIVGPAMAGIMMGTISSAGVVWTNLVAYLLNIVSFMSMKAPPSQSPPKEASPWSNLLGGAKQTWNNRAVLGLMIAGLVYNGLCSPARNTLFPVFAAGTFRAGAQGLGFLNSAFGFGGLAGAVAAVFLSSTRHKSKASVAAVVASGVVFALISLTSSYSLALILAVLLGLASSTFLSLSNALLLQLTPTAFRGRVMGVRGMVILSNAPGGLLVGALAEVLGGRGAGAAMGVAAMASIAGTVWLVPAMMRRDDGLTESAAAKPPGGPGDAPVRSQLGPASGHESDH